MVRRGHILCTFAYILIYLNSLPCHNSPLLVVLLDGVRWDYIHHFSLKSWQTVRKRGTVAEYMVPVFPADSYPNWNSISTGLYPDSHGFPFNFLYDEARGDFFLQHPHPNVSHSHWWQAAEPIWITAEKQKLTTALFGWGGCEVAINGSQPSYCDPFEDRNAEEELEYLKTSLNEAVDLLMHKGIDLVMVYNQLLDMTGHKYGVNSPELNDALMDVDGQISILVAKIEKSEEINVIILSDHGMSQTTKDAAIFIKTEEYISKEDVFKVMGHGSTQEILLKPENIKKVSESIKQNIPRGLDVYTQKDIPERFYLRNCKLLPQIMLVAHPGYYILPLCNELQLPKPCGETLNGTHGYDPTVSSDMRAIFTAIGPAFKKNFIAPPIQAVDGYNLMCHLLNIIPRPNNGSWTRIRYFLKEVLLHDDL